MNGVRRYNRINANAQLSRRDLCGITARLLTSLDTPPVDIAVDIVEQKTEKADYNRNI